MSDSIKNLTKKILDFRDRRDWKMFHTPRNLAESLAIEAAEVLELFQWKSKKEVEKYLTKNKDDLAEEIADVLNYLLLLAHETGIDPAKALEDKLELNEKRYPENKARGSAKKYTEL
jgi:NTP pyrophosphatase (non-canonical NTP hydrolase)